MIRCTIDTNVPIVANGHSDPSDGGKQPSIDCRLAAIAFLENVGTNGRVVLDVEGAIQAEYHRHLNPSGQPGVGDRFYQTIINSAPKLVDRVSLPKRLDGEYEDFPDDPALKGFDPSDRKFAALSRREKIPVINSTDSDWRDSKDALQKNGVAIMFLCGSEKDKWFV